MAPGRQCQHDGRTTFRSWKRADRRAERLPEPARVYWCPHAGGYHVTGSTRSEYDATRAQWLKEKP